MLMGPPASAAGDKGLETLAGLGVDRADPRFVELDRDLAAVGELNEVEVADAAPGIEPRAPGAPEGLRPPAPAATPATRGIARSIKLFRAFRQEKSDPDLFYALIADDAVSLLAQRLALAGSLVLDVGGGAGYSAKAFRAAGADCFVAERDLAELTWRGAAPRGSLLGDGNRLPLRSACADLVVASNVLEHVSEPFAVIDEMTRVARPGGYIWLSFTNWYGPWGGHETSPWHYLGAERAARRYERRHGHPPKNRYGQSMFAMHVGSTLHYLKRHPQLEVVAARPRYLPGWASPIVKVPGVRELLTWNLELLARRR